MRAAAELLREAGAEVTDAFGVVGLPFLDYDKNLGNLSISTLINYDSE